MMNLVEIKKSTIREIRETERLVSQTENLIKSIREGGEKVHLIWDFDGVLTSPRDDDVFFMLNGKTEKYYEYEMRMIKTPLENGPWAELFDSCGRLQESQDIVTARSTVAALRVFSWLSARDNRLSSVQWMLFIGHQSKIGSYGIILDHFRGAKDTHIVCVDDSPRHCSDFRDAANARPDMAKRCRDICSPKIRTYDASEITEEINAVMSFSGRTRKITVRKPQGDGDSGRVIRVTRNFEKMITDRFRT
ncbi:5'-nucleotidase [Candidatus Uhrbacteria bacterium]|nr:5'-nucleotidase [Candidatus Uhrbacteria bacterium]